ncbi:MAG: ORF6N domain-containing protein [Thermoanaerobaculia bacterium]
MAPASRVASRILELRGQRVLLDRDLAELYGVPTKQLNQSVRRNLERFPADLMFRLSPEEVENSRSQSVTSNSRGEPRHPPFAFTELGVAMLSSVLRSPRAIQVNIEIMRAFVRLRSFLAGHEELARKLDALERRYDAQFGAVFEAIRALVTEEARPARRIGFAEVPHRS